jgi:putative radical SAM enzyme (TIGR03279 family)
LSSHINGGIIAAIEPESFAAEIGLQAGDEIIEVNGQPVEDVIDVQFYAADEWIELKIRRNGMLLTCRGGRDYNQTLGIEFEHPTFDIDIRRCNNLCPFCFVLQMPSRMRRALYVKDDDYRYSFLHGHFVTLTNLSDHDWQRIADQFLSPLYVSVHATELNVRRACLRNPAAPDIMPQLRWLAERDIEVHTQLVITPGLNDGPHLGRSIRDLATLWPHVKSVCVVPVGLTKHHRYDRRPLTKAEMRVIVDEVQGYQREYLAQLGVRFAYLTDEWYLQLDEPIPSRSCYDDLSLEENGQGMVRYFLDDWKVVKREIRSRKPAGRQRIRAHYHSATLATGTLFAPTLTKAAKEFARLSGLPVDVRSIVNERLGETITVSGLLMGDDVINQLRACELGEVVVLPRIMFDHPQGIALDDVSPLRIAQLLERPVALADAMGDVLDALTGRNPLLIKPTDGHIPLDVMKAGGWSVEKYL